MIQTWSDPSRLGHKACTTAGWRERQDLVGLSEKINDTAA
jgi:hypothetical protein